jgi:hypothetical protein
MGSIFYLGLLVIAVWSLYRDFIKTQGYVFQKVLHVFFIFFLFTTNATVFKSFINLIRNYQTFSEWSILTQIEYMPVKVAFLNSIASQILGITIYALTFALLVRANFARKIIVWVLPFYILLQLPLLHYKYMTRMNSEYGMVVIGVLGVFLAFYTMIFFVYRGKKMREFFHAKRSKELTQP